MYIYNARKNVSFNASLFVMIVANEKEVLGYLPREEEPYHIAEYDSPEKASAICADIAKKLGLGCISYYINEERAERR